jgi:tRNA 2-thiocytidine biosynthesis protein TtcA
MLADWEHKQPGRIESIFRALGNVTPSHLADCTLFDFAGLRTGAEVPRANAHAWIAGAEQTGETE